MSDDESILPHVGDLRSFGHRNGSSIKEEEENDKHTNPILSLDNIDEFIEHDIAGPTYKFYDKWDKRDYFSNQFQDDIFPLQNKINEKTTFTRIGDDSVDVINMPLASLDIEKDILDDFTILCIGRRRSGKTWACRWILYHLRHRFPCGICITGTKLNNFWARYIPAEYIHDVEDINIVLETVYERQRFLLKHPETGIDHRMFIILDDVMKDKYKVRFSKALSQAFTDGRHYGILTIITSQDPKGIPPDLRENTDLAVIFRQFQQGRKEAVASDFLDYIPLKKDRMKFLWEKTRKIDSETGLQINEEELDVVGLEHSVPVALCVLQAQLSEDYSKVFKKLVAEDPGEFAMGDTGYWKVLEDGSYNRLINTFDEIVKRPRPKQKKKKRSNRKR